jgi:hypothetical protein
MKTDESDEQNANAPASRRESLEPGSNVTVARLSHRKKQFEPTVTTEQGRQIELSDEHSANAAAPITESLEPSSNTTFDRFDRGEHHSAARLSVNEGIMTSDSSPK